MRRILLILIIIAAMIFPVNALEIQPPEVPESAAQFMPEHTGDLGQGIAELISKALRIIDPNIQEASSVCLRLIAVVLTISVMQTFSEPVKTVAAVAGTTALALLMLHNTKAMVRLAVEAITEIVQYGKMLLPVMTSAMAAQGQLSSSAALYAASAFFITVLSGLITDFFIPVVYLYMMLTTANSATGENLLKKLSEIIKSFMGWILKTTLIVFTTYLSITGVVGGVTDAAALKATKVTISTVVPVVGGILSDASEAVLVSAGLLKNAAGIYGILALIALFLEPFLRIGVHYIFLKLSGAICSIFSSKQMAELVSDYASALGLLLGMLGASCLMQLISTVCFLKGVG